MPSENKIAIFMLNLSGGGAERAMLNLALLLKDRYRIQLVLTRAEGPYLSEAREHQLEVIDLGCARPRWALTPFLKYAVREKPDLVISALEAPNVIAALTKVVIPYRLIVTEHSTPSRHYAKQKNPLLRTYPYWAPLPYRLADSIVAVSDGVAEDAARTYRIPRNRVSTIYNPVVTPSFFERMRDPIEHPFFQYSDPIIVAAGRLSEEKGFDILLHALSLVLKERPARLIIFGEGPERGNLEKLAQDLGIVSHVSMPGFTPHLPAYLSRANLFVLSSRWEGLPTVLIEALAAGLPVVATDCPSGPREILEEGKWGKLVPVENAHALAQAILEQLRKPLLPEPQSWERFAEESVSARWISHIEEVLSSAKASSKKKGQ